MLTSASQRLLRDHIETFERLEILCLVHDAPASAREIATHLRLTPSAVAVEVARLEEALLVDDSPEGLRYAPHTDQLRAAAGELVHVRRTHLTFILRALNQLAIERLRGVAVKSFR